MLKEGTSLLVGTHKVRVIRFLSSGGFSKIYEVSMDPKESGTDIGCLKQVLVPDKNGLNLLRKEVDVMKTLRKARSIVKYYDSNAERLPDGSYQVLVLMELCPNNSLLHYMNDRIRSKLAEPEILKIMLDISIGVFEMHKIKLVHRDIKIENVLIDAKHSFKLCDFGSVSSPIRPPKDQQEFQLLSHDILYNTTPQYRAPEMIDLYRGFPVDERSDIWALGCFLYKLCYYTTPFEAAGDIAILHASFQFPPAPAYSGDLKNLIIIMLQESPLYRPNIVQILMLLSKMMGKDYETLGVEDFFHAGPYNFQALHEMQRDKQNQLLKQQQLYYEQQKQQQEYELRQQQIAPGTNASSANSQKDTGGSNAVPELEHGYRGRSSESLAEVKSRDSSAVIHTSDATGKSSQKSASDSSHAGIATPASEESDVDLSELDKVEERYPSLEEIEVPITGNTSASLPRSSFEKSNNSSNVDIGEKSFPRASELESATGWKQAASSHIDKGAEKLVDEIFTNDEAAPKAPLVSPEQRFSDKSQEEITFESLVESAPAEIEAPVAPSYVKPQEPLLDFDAPVKDYKKSRPARSSDNKGVAPGPVASAKPFAGGMFEQLQPTCDPTSPHGAAAGQRYKHHREGSNPWGNAIDKQGLSRSGSSARVHSSDLSQRVEALKLSAPPEIAIDGDLIQLEAALESSGTSTAKPYAAPEEARPRAEVSLVDLEIDEAPRKKSDEFRPRFKKSLTEHTPISFQEQVIDFESDDENSKSAMSRMSIRDKLRKSRKHSDHKRSEGGAGDKKRLSFFGGTSD